MAHASPPTGMEKALCKMLDLIDKRLCGNRQEPVRMFLAGGMAVNYYCDTRFTEDVDASFSKRVILPHAEDLVVPYKRETGEDSYLYFDAQYNPSFGLMHDDFQKDAQEWIGIGNEKRCIHLYVLAPVDLAVSKIVRYSEDDHKDIMALANAGLITPESVRCRAEEALKLYAGNTDHIKQVIRGVAREIELAQGE